jgi:hypothetical protein
MSGPDSVLPEERELFALQRARARLARLFLRFLLLDIVLLLTWLTLERYLPRGGP